MQILVQISKDTFIFSDLHVRGALAYLKVGALHNLHGHCYIVVPIQVEKMRAELASLSHCAVPFLSRAAVNLSWYDYAM